MYIQFLSEKKKNKETTGGKICRERERVLVWFALRLKIKIILLFNLFLLLFINSF